MEFVIDPNHRLIKRDLIGLSNPVVDSYSAALDTNIPVSLFVLESDNIGKASEW